MMRSAARENRLREGIRLKAFSVQPSAIGEGPTDERRGDSVSSPEMRPKLRLRDAGVAPLVARKERAAVEDVALQPDLGGEGRADRERVAPERAAVDEHFEPQAFEVEVDPVKLAARQRVAQGLERDDAARERPVVLVRGARGRGLF